MRGTKLVISNLDSRVPGHFCRPFELHIGNNHNFFVHFIPNIWKICLIRLIPSKHRGIQDERNSKGKREEDHVKGIKLCSCSLFRPEWRMTKAAFPFPSVWLILDRFLLAIAFWSPFTQSIIYFRKLGIVNFFSPPLRCKFSTTQKCPSRKPVSVPLKCNHGET